MEKIFFIAPLLSTFILLNNASLLSNHIPKISITPETALLDEPIEIFISNLTANEQIIIEASCEDKDNNLWSAYATFQADESGLINVAKQAPITGSYNEIDPMGLFWSMTPSKREVTFFYFDENKDELSITLSISSPNKFKIEKTIKRLFIAPNIEKRKIRENGIVGTFFYPKHTKNMPGIIVIPDSSGGIPEEKSKILASHGYAVLALGYFGLEGLPEKLDNIPLEYFQNAMLWLKKQSVANPNNIALFGTSRGGELVLLLASTFPKEINAVIACVPSSLVYSGFPQVDQPSWIYKNSPLPFFPTPYYEDILNAVKDGKVAFHSGTFEDPYEITPHFLYGMSKFHQIIDTATIPVENICCSILILSGEDDKMWPSTLHGKLIMERLDKKGSNIERKHLHFPNAGHMFLFPYPPYIPVISKPTFYSEGNNWTSFGGTAQGNAQATKESWREILSFLEKTLIKEKYHENK